MSKFIAVVAFLLLVAPPLHAVNISPNGIGEAAVVPYYTVRDGWLTTLNITNTTASKIALKVRFKEALNGREVLNFTVTLAAHDVIAGVISDTDTGPIFRPIDQPDPQGQGRSTCIVPSSIRDNGQVPLVDTSFGPSSSSNDDGGPQGVDRAREGHIELIVMGHTNSNDGIGGAIQNFDCDAVHDAFQEGDNGSQFRPIALTAQQFGEPIDSIMVTAGLLNPQRGVDVEVPVTTWSNFYNRNGDPRPEIITAAENENCTSTVADTDRWEPGGSVAGYCRNLIAAQNASQALEPSLNSGYPAIASWWDNENFPIYIEPSERTQYTLGAAPANLPPASSSLTLPRFVDALSLTIQKTEFANQWSINPALGVATEWIMSHPTKGYYTDSSDAAASSLAADRNGVRLLGADLPYSPFTQVFQQSTDGDRATAGSENGLDLAGHDRTALDPLEGGVVTIPPPVALGFVIVNAKSAAYSMSFTSSGSETSSPKIFSSAHEVQADFSYTVQVAGWASAFPLGETFSVNHQDGPLMGQAENIRGLPVLGFAVRQRTFGDAAANYATSTTHKDSVRFSVD